MLKVDTEREPSRGPPRYFAVIPLALVLSGDAGWFRVGDQPTVDIPGRRLLRSLLLVLAKSHCEAPGRSLSTEELVGRVWPGDRSPHTCARNRLYFAINALRRLGLRGIVVRSQGGYALATHTVVSFR